jgi:hypothetical protein
MNSIQKAAAATVALVITLVGATLATAPLALADIHSTATHQGTSVSFTQSNSSMRASFRHG